MKHARSESAPFSDALAHVMTQFPPTPQTLLQQALADENVANVKQAVTQLIASWKAGVAPPDDATQTAFKDTVAAYLREVDPEHSTGRKDLYMCGNQKNGRLINGHKVEICRAQWTRLMENIRVVTCASGHIAFITQSGDLYMCGFYEDDEGNNCVHLEPHLICSNVKLANSSSDLIYYVTNDDMLHSFPSHVVEPMHMPNIKSIAANEYPTLYILLEDGTLQEWNAEGVFSLTKTIFYDVMDIACNRKNLAVITMDLNLYVMGMGKFKYCTTQKSDKGYFSHVLSDCVRVSFGSGHIAAVTSGGHLIMSGNNERGQLGTGNNKEVYAPQLALQGIVRISCGFDSTMAISKNGELYGFGGNDDGNLGCETKLVHTPTITFKNVCDVSCGSRHTAILVEVPEFPFCLE